MHGFRTHFTFIRLFSRLCVRFYFVFFRLIERHAVVKQRQMIAVYCICDVRMCVSVCVIKRITITNELIKVICCFWFFQWMLHWQLWLSSPSNGASGEERLPRVQSARALYMCNASAPRILRNRNVISDYWVAIAVHYVLTLLWAHEHVN